MAKLETLQAVKSVHDSGYGDPYPIASTGAADDSADDMVREPALFAASISITTETQPEETLLFPAAAEDVASAAMNSELPTLQHIFDESSQHSNEERKEVFLCSECNIVFCSKQLCVQHMSEIHQIMNFTFSEIELLEDSKKSLVQSRKVNPPLKYSEAGGVVVPKKFQVTKDSHLYRCSSCTSKFESLEICHLHEESHVQGFRNGKSSTTFVCRICEESTDKPRNSNEPASFVPLPQQFPNWSKCSWHLWKQHKIDCELHSCSFHDCKFKSLFVHKVREHEAIHSPIHAFRCTTCHKAFKQLKQLRTHEKYHSIKNTKLPAPDDSRWYTTKECPICKRVLSDSRCLKKHIAAVHNKLKPHSCNICGHLSARKAELQLHMRQHTGEKPYKCSTCDFATGDHNSLRRHQLTHGAHKTYSCNLCSFKCIQSSGFKKHIIAKHSNALDSSIFVCPYCPLISVNGEMYGNHIKDHDDGRIPIQDMEAEKESSSSSPPLKTKSNKDVSFVSADDSSSNSNASCNEKRNTATPIPVSRYWIRDDDSIDLVDTGGITIPAQVTNTSELSDSITGEILPTT